jgi:hypothetical protein
VFAEHDEWLVGCEFVSAPKGFSPTGETLMGYPALWNPESLSTDGTAIPYERAKLSLVGTVFPQTRASTGEQTPVLVLQDWDALHANHPGFQDSGVEEWLGIAVHEAFHAHQMWHPRLRAMFEAMKGKAPVVTDDLAKYVKNDPEYRATVEREINALRVSIDSVTDANSARTALCRWQELRSARGVAFAAKLEAAMPNKQAWAMDNFYTFLEGTARYVEAQFLINPSPETSEFLRGEKTFKNFAATRGKPPTALPGLSSGSSKYVYTIGMYVSFLLDRADPSWKNHVFDTDGLLISEAERVCAGR